jgi:Protein of unknown function (DUF1194)
MYVGAPSCSILTVTLVAMLRHVRGSFVMSIAGYKDYAEAIHRKLLREIEPNLVELEGDVHLEFARR